MAEIMDFDKEIKEEVMADIEELLGKSDQQFALMEFAEIKREVFSEDGSANKNPSDLSGVISENHIVNIDNEIKEENLSDDGLANNDSDYTSSEHDVIVEDEIKQEDSVEIKKEETSDEGEISKVANSKKGAREKARKIHVCKICKETFNDTKKMQKHLRTYHAITRKSALKAFHSIEEPVDDMDKSLDSDNIVEVLKSDDTMEILNVLENSEGASMSSLPETMEIMNTDQPAEPMKVSEFTMHECEICLRLFKSRRSLLRHSKTHSEDNLGVESTIKTEITEGEDNNENDNMTLNIVDNMRGNLTTLYDEKKYVCDFCGARFTKLNNKKAHMKLHAGLKPHKCTICPAAFSQKSTLKSHMAMHSGEKRFRCSYCQVGFTTHTLLKKHEMMHRGEKPLTCEICNLKFLTEKGYKTHLNKHNSEKRFKCEICGAGFIKGLSYLQHMKRDIHKGDTEFKCPYCDVELTTKKRFENHLLRHAQPQKVDKCDICSAEFRGKGSLANHLKIHIQGELYRCDVCDATFTQKYQLTVHQRVHKGEALFNCEQCQMTFYTKAAQSFHMKFHHGYRG